MVFNIISRNCKEAKEELPETFLLSKIRVKYLFEGVYVNDFDETDYENVFIWRCEASFIRVLIHFVKYKHIPKIVLYKGVITFI